MKVNEPKQGGWPTNLAEVAKLVFSGAYHNPCSCTPEFTPTRLRWLLLPIGTTTQEQQKALGDLKQWWPVKALEEAARLDFRDAYESILRFALGRLGIHPPKGIRVSPPGKPGRPRSQKTDQIFFTWMDLNRPKLNTNRLAQRVYGAEFSNADPARRKKLRDQCRRAVERRLKEATK